MSQHIGTFPLLVATISLATLSTACKYTTRSEATGQSTQSNGPADSLPGNSDVLISIPQFSNQNHLLFNIQRSIVETIAAECEGDQDGAGCRKALAIRQFLAVVEENGCTPKALDPSSAFALDLAAGSSLLAPEYTGFGGKRVDHRNETDTRSYVSELHALGIVHLSVENWILTSKFDTSSVESCTDAVAKIANGNRTIRELGKRYCDRFEIARPPRISMTQLVESINAKIEAINAHLKLLNTSHSANVSNESHFSEDQKRDFDAYLADWNRLFQDHIVPNHLDMPTVLKVLGTFQEVRDHYDARREQLLFDIYKPLDQSTVTRAVEARLARNANFIDRARRVLATTEMPLEPIAGRTSLDRAIHLIGLAYAELPELFAIVEGSQPENAHLLCLGLQTKQRYDRVEENTQTGLDILAGLSGIGAARAVFSSLAPKLLFRRLALDASLSTSRAIVSFSNLIFLASNISQITPALEFERLVLDTTARLQLTGSSTTGHSESITAAYRNVVTKSVLAVLSGSALVGDVLIYLKRAWIVVKQGKPFENVAASLDEISTTIAKQKAPLLSQSDIQDLDQIFARASDQFLRAEAEAFGSTSRTELLTRRFRYVKGSTESDLSLEKLRTKYSVGNNKRIYNEDTDELLFGQANVSPAFSDASPFAKTVPEATTGGTVVQVKRGMELKEIAKNLVEGKYGPEMFPIQAIEINGELITINNRSLTILKMVGKKPSRVSILTEADLPSSGPDSLLSILRRLEAMPGNRGSSVSYIRTDGVNLAGEARASWDWDAPLGMKVE